MSAYWSSNGCCSPNSFRCFFCFFVKLLKFWCFCLLLPIFIHTRVRLTAALLRWWFSRQVRAPLFAPPPPGGVEESLLLLLLRHKHERFSPNVMFQHFNSRLCGVVRESVHHLIRFITYIITENTSQWCTNAILSTDFVFLYTQFI